MNRTEYKDEIEINAETFIKDQATQLIEFLEKEWTKLSILSWVTSKDFDPEVEVLILREALSLARKRDAK